jgi:beta-N-acetylhexosaminidase
MDGITKYFPPGEAELQSLLAGSDIILGPFLEEAYARILDAARSGELPMERLDSSIRRILRAKAWCGLDENRFVDTGELPYRIASARTRDDTRRIAESSITLLKNEGGFLPLDVSKYRRVLGVLYYDHPLGDIGDAFLNALRRRATGLSAQFYQEGLTNESGNIRTAVLPADCDPRFEEDVIREASSYDAVILAFVYRIIMRRNTPNLRPRAAAFADRLAATGVPVCAVSFGSPYVLGQVPGVRAFTAAYMYSPAVQEAAVRAVFGEIPFAGKVPVKILTE